MRPFGYAALLSTVLLGACDAAPEERYDPSRQAILTPATPIPPGTAPVGTMEYLKSLEPPGPPMTLSTAKEGREGYQIFCTPCHGPSGYGDGSVTGRGFPSPPSFHQDTLLVIEPAGIVAVITEGKGQMLSLAERIPPAERWAIAYYVKALQLSQRSPEARRDASGGALP